MFDIRKSLKRLNLYKIINKNVYFGSSEMNPINTNPRRKTKKNTTSKNNPPPSMFVSWCLVPKSDVADPSSHWRLIQGALPASSSSSSSRQAPLGTWSDYLRSTLRRNTRETSGEKMWREMDAGFFWGLKFVKRHLAEKFCF